MNPGVEHARGFAAATRVIAVTSTVKFAYQCPAFAGAALHNDPTKVAALQRRGQQPAENKRFRGNPGKKTLSRDY
jgi:hypothetical protein